MFKRAKQVRSQLSLIFQSRALRHLERALYARHRRAPLLAKEIPTVPEALKAKLSSVEHAPEPLAKVMPSFKAPPPAPAQVRQVMASQNVHVQSV